MKSARYRWIWILLGAVALIAAAVLYMVLPMRSARIDRKAVAAQAATYYNARLGEIADSVNADEAQRSVEGD